MNWLPAWGWSIVTIVIILAGLSIGGRGPEGRAVSRAIFPYAAALVLAVTILSYWREHVDPTGRLWLINAATVLGALYLTVPLWHFGVVLPKIPGDPVVVRWWVNGVVLILAVALYLILARISRKS